jgi:hypothetical protein
LMQAAAVTLYVCVKWVVTLHWSNESFNSYAYSCADLRN